MKIKGMTARSDSLSAVNCDASLVKIRHGVNSCVLRFAKTEEEVQRQRLLRANVEAVFPQDARWQLEDVHFWFSASNCPILATI
jgi:hypothetical protein